MILNILPTEAATIQSMANQIAETATKYIQEKDSFTLVLSGGQTPKRLYETLAAPPFKESINWSKVFFFFGDERFVDATDEASNYNMAARSLLYPLQIPREQIFAIDTSIAINKAAEQYQQRLESFFGTDEIVFDLVLLGVGDNLHTASLFPHTAVLKETMPGVRAVKTNDTNAYRITMNAPLINNARSVYFLVAGKDKALAVHQVFEGKTDTDAFPVQLIKTADAHWFIDEAAAAYL